MSLAKRHALVIGSTSCIRLAIARALAKEGAGVAINGMGAIRRKSKPSARAQRAGVEGEFGVQAFTTAPTGAIGRPQKRSCGDSATRSERFAAATNAPAAPAKKPANDLSDSVARTPPPPAMPFDKTRPDAQASLDRR
jgi:hypothetical protein